MTVGVTVIVDSPDVSDTTTTLPGTEPLGSDGRAVKTSKQDELTVKLEEPTADNIDAECEFFISVYKL